MSKELEALNKIQHDFGQLKGQELVSCYETIFNALQRLEAIDNSNPSEALECSLKLYKMVESAGNGNGFNLNEAWKYHNTIKQALLKAQEPKQYLKWEDLKKLGKEVKVKLNGVEYLLCKKIVLGFPEYYLYPEGNQKPVLMCLGDNDYEKQFFNALHLERVEE